MIDYEKTPPNCSLCGDCPECGRSSGEHSLGCPNDRSNLGVAMIDGKVVFKPTTVDYPAVPDPDPRLEQTHEVNADKLLPVLERIADSLERLAGAKPKLMNPAPGGQYAERPAIQWVHPCSAPPCSKAYEPSESDEPPRFFPIDHSLIDGQENREK